jgi:hypothetical protein
MNFSGKRSYVLITVEGSVISWRSHALDEIYKRFRIAFLVGSLAAFVNTGHGRIKV